MATGMTSFKLTPSRSAFRSKQVRVVGASRRATAGSQLPYLFDQLAFHRLLGDQPYRPPRPASGWRAKDHGDNALAVLSIQQRLWDRAGRIVNRPLQPSFQITLAAISQAALAEMPIPAPASTVDWPASICPSTSARITVRTDCIPRLNNSSICCCSCRESLIFKPLCQPAPSL